MFFFGIYGIFVMLEIIFNVDLEICLISDEYMI